MHLKYFRICEEMIIEIIIMIKLMMIREQTTSDGYNGNDYCHGDYNSDDEIIMIIFDND